MIGFALLRRQNGEWFPEALDQIDFNVFAAVADGCLAVKAADVPDAVGDLSSAPAHYPRISSTSRT